MNFNEMQFVPILVHPDMKADPLLRDNPRYVTALPADKMLGDYVKFSTFVYRPCKQDAGIVPCGF